MAFAIAAELVENHWIKKAKKPGGTPERSAKENAGKDIPFPHLFSPDCKMGKISGAQKAACFARIP